MEDEIKLKNSDPLKIDKPSICPHCNKGIDPKILNYFPFRITNEPLICVCFQCPICRQIFFAYYILDDDFLPVPACYWEGYRHPLQIIGGNGLTREFPKEISDLSPNFVAIYNDTYKAEQKGLSTIVGIGYRLAFEYLIKDFCVSLNPEEKDKISKKQLSQCISDYLDSDIKELIKRATWLGNDFAHCESKHPDMHVDDFKKLIKLCVSKIVGKIQEKFYLESIDKK